MAEAARETEPRAATTGLSETAATATTATAGVGSAVEAMAEEVTTAVVAEETGVEAAISRTLE